MEQKERIDRYQPLFLSLDEVVARDSTARIIEQFVEVCDLKQMKIQSAGEKRTGRPAFGAASLCMLYVYGYYHGIRSSRRLEAECSRNLEVMWLMGGLKPSYKTISEFRKNNLKALKQMFYRFTMMCQEWGLVGGELVAVDGTKIKASNNKKQCFTQEKLEDRISGIDRQIASYLTEMDNTDQREEGLGAPDAAKRLAALQARKEEYQGYLERLEATGEREVSVTDPDARLMKSRQGSVEMAYNVQSAVDAKAHIIVDYEVSQSPSDHHLLSHMVKKVKKRYRLKHFKVLADKGYYNGEDLEKVKEQGVDAIVSKQKSSDPKDQPSAFHTERFVYNKEGDFFTCPMGKCLLPHSRQGSPRRNYFNKAACSGCPCLADCASGQRPYRTVSRSQYAEIYDEVDANTRKNKALYRQRQQLVEHPFGTVKFAMHGYYFLLRTRRKVRTEVALMFLGYNLRRAIKTLGFDAIMAGLRAEKARMRACFLFFLRENALKHLFLQPCLVAFSA